MDIEIKDNLNLPWKVTDCADCSLPQIKDSKGEDILIAHPTHIEIKKEHAEILVNAFNEFMTGRKNFKWTSK